MGAKWRKAYIILIIWLVVISMLLRSLPPVFNTEIDPPTSGVLPYLQQGGELAVSDQGYKVRLEMGQANMPLTLHVLNPSDKLVNVFSEDMTKLMHLIVVDRSLQFFDHLHPVYEGDGAFRTELNLPYGGDYLLVTEFIPDNKGVTVYKQWLEAPGVERDPIDVKIDEIYTKIVDGISFTLSAMPSFKEIRAKQMVMLNFQYEDSLTGEPVQLERFLGTGGHCVILDEKAEEYVHVHAMDDMSAEGNVMFHAEFPKAGIYKIWGQFQYKGNVITVPFTVMVK
ncbi:hypothetical protein I6N90_18100 [Paenibacillus sp. GSMTC-2017]|uniref:hypothetical protein n=1 Tax=Paenibacillus sp. GSMTC-2017 TaxID=2794350 RepID=UPI0018D9FDFE|nr:hypothetical protein [Paenibacillus sp. GSMTC-2017]MBH5319713.1 hypothetical protein [Paenibacillus sp. GSMTC-2017]